VSTPLTESASFDSQVIVPQDGIDDETAASLVPAFQALANRSRILKTILDLFNIGGTQNSTGDIRINTSTGKITRINDLIISSHADNGTVIAEGTGGLIVPSGGAVISGNTTFGGQSVIGGVGNTTVLNADTTYVRGRLQWHRVVVRGGGVGASSYSTLYVDRLFAKLGDITAGASWQISNSPTAEEPNEIHIMNDDTTAVAIKDPSGTTILNMARLPGYVYSATFSYVSGAWTYTNYTAVPT
jgi:hypothetical protein